MRIVIFIAVIWFCSCSNGKSDIVKGTDLNHLLKSWDAETQNALKKLSMEDSLVSGKALLISASLSDTSQYDFLERKTFLSMIDSNIVSFKNEGNELLIVEVREDGESVSNIKAIIGGGEVSLYTKASNNSWYLNKSNPITKEQSDSIMQLKNDKNHNQPYLWGNDINDVLIITKVSKQGNSITPIFNLSANSINYLKKSIFHSTSK